MSPPEVVYDLMKTHHALSYIIYSLVDEFIIKMDSFGKCSYNKFLQILQTYEMKCCYCAIDFDVEPGNIEANKIVLIKWCPDFSMFEDRMKYSMHFNVLKNALPGVNMCVDAFDIKEIGREAMEIAFRSVENDENVVE